MDEHRNVQTFGSAGGQQISARGRAAHPGDDDGAGPGDRRVGHGSKGRGRSALRGEAQQGVAHAVDVDAGPPGRIVELQRAVTVSDVSNSHSREDTPSSGQVTRYAVPW